MWTIPFIILLAGIVVYCMVGRRKATEPDVDHARTYRQRNHGNEVWITLPDENTSEGEPCVIEVFEDDAR